jgi:hypothetical protein
MGIQRMHIERVLHKKARSKAEPVRSYKGCRLENNGIRGDRKLIKETEPARGRGNE